MLESRKINTFGAYISIFLLVIITNNVYGEDTIPYTLSWQGCVDDYLAETYDPGEVYFELNGDDIVVNHLGVTYNCCAAIDIDVEFSDVSDSEEYHIEITEYDTYPVEPPCYCICPFDIEITLEDHDPVEFTVQVWNADHSMLFGEDIITVPISIKFKTTIPQSVHE